MKTRIPVLLLTALVPLAACDTGGEELEMGDEVETLPAAEAPMETEAETVGLTEWDTDANQQLARNEWDAWYADQTVFQDWDADGQEGLTSEEFAGGAAGFWDADGDGSLTESEWNEGMNLWYSDAEYGEWGEWDANGDSVLDANEVAEGFEREGLYDTVDRDSDALIDDEELADWWFDLWDANDDQSIDTTEWDEVGAEWSRVGSGF